MTFDIVGDKAETAMAISRICGLLRPGMEVEKVVGLKGQALRFLCVLAGSSLCY